MADVRLIKKDGSLNISKKRKKIQINDLYHSLLSMKWGTLLKYIAILYIIINLIFGILYFSAGDNAVLNAHHESKIAYFLDCFFFSVTTFATIGYGNLSPNGFLSNVIMMIEAFFGIVTTAILTGIFFAKFSKPTSKVLFSKVALVTKFDGENYFNFRIANQRANQIVEAKVTLLLSKNETTKEGDLFRNLYDLKLERDVSPLFALSWVVEHKLDENSPLFKMTQKELIESEAEILVTLTGFDETFGQTIHARHSYIPNEIIPNKRFVDILKRTPSGVSVSIEKLHDYEEMRS